MTSQFRLANWLVNPLECTIVDVAQKRKIEPKAMDLLVLLAKADGKLLTRNQIFEALWKDQIIADHVLYNLIANLRKNLNYDPQHKEFIVTSPKKGYKLFHPVRWVTTENTSNQTSFTNKNKQRYAFLSPRYLVVSIFVFSVLMVISNGLFDTTEQPLSNTQPSIAVLPFDVFDGLEDTHYFADGLAEEIIHQLTVIPELKVIARTSSFAFRNKGLDTFELAEKLDVSYILEGSVRREAQQLRITVQLINANQGNHVWSKVFSASDQNLFVLQQQISIAVAESVMPPDTQIAQQQLRRHPTFGDAYMHYLRGSAKTNRGTPEDYANSILEYKKAIALDPNYALAHVALALNTLVLLQYQMMTPEEAEQTATTAINNALRIQPNLPIAHVSKGLYWLNNHQYDKAELAFRRALSLDPTLALAHHNYGYMLWLQDDHQGALRQFQQALAQNPMSAITNFAVADSLLATGKLADALKQYQHCIVLLPDYPACRLGLANFYRLTNKINLAKEHMDKAAQMLPEDNIYWLSANALQQWFEGNIEDAQNNLKLLKRYEGGGFFELYLAALFSWNKGHTEDWRREMMQNHQQWPQNPSAAISYGLAAYMNNECDIALTEYENALSKQIDSYGKFNVIALGTSHVINMADCYKRNNNQPKFKEMLKIFSTQLTEFELNDFSVPGVNLVQAKYLYFQGDKRSANEILKNLEQSQWPLIWLAKVDPVLKNISSK
jgi:TolB-like protein/DNA-binding winged helix-turn-helix (wHTH) protein/lipoprotein NlpI